MATHNGTIIKFSEDGEEYPAPPGFNPRKPDFKTFNEAVCRKYRDDLAAEAAREANLREAGLAESSSAAGNEDLGPDPILKPAERKKPSA